MNVDSHWLAVTACQCPRASAYIPRVQKKNEKKLNASQTPFLTCAKAAKRARARTMNAKNFIVSELEGWEWV